VDRAAGQAEHRDLGDELERELGPLPVVVGDRRDLARAEGAQPVADLAVGVGQQLVHEVEVAR
jgi:hypothetical protein